MVLSLSMLAGCGKASHNGHVDGNWEIMSIENRQDGTVTVPDQHFIALYLHVVNLFPNGISGNMHYSKQEQNQRRMAEEELPETPLSSSLRLSLLP